MNKALKIVVGLVALISSFFSGQIVEKNQNPSFGAEVVVEHVPDPARVIDVLNQLDLTPEDLVRLIPVAPVDDAVAKTISTDSDLKKHLIDNVLDGNKPAFGGILNSWEVQTLYKRIGEEKGIFVPENFNENGDIDIYKILRENESITVDPYEN